MHGPLFRGAFGTSSLLTEKDLKMFHLKLLEKDLGYKDDFGRMTMLNECELNELVVLLEHVGASRFATNVAKDFFAEYTKLIHSEE